MIGWFSKRRVSRRRPKAADPRSAMGRGLEQLEGRAMMAVAQLSTAEVESLLDKASAATPSTNAIIAVVAGFSAPPEKQAVRYFVCGIRLPSIKFSRNAMAGI